MTLRYLEIFLALARTPNMRDAAAKLFISQAAVSSALGLVEAARYITIGVITLATANPARRPRPVRRAESAAEASRAATGRMLRNRMA